MSNKLPKGWVQTKLKNVINRISNGTTERQNKEGKGIPVTRIETISTGRINFGKVGYIRNTSKQLIEKYKLITGDILFSHINSDLHLGKTAVFDLPDNRLLHGMNLLLIRADKDILNPILLHYLFNYYRFSGIFIKIAQHAVNQSSLNQAKLKNLDIPLPPLPEQQRIVAKIEELFSDLDAGVESLKKIKEQLKRYRQAVLKYAFEGKLTADWRQRMLNDKLRIFNEKDDLSRFKIDNSKLKDFPELPERWVGTRIGKLVLFEYGKGLPKRKREKGSVPVYGSNGIVGYHSKSLVKGPCIIVGRKGTAGMVHLSKEDCWPIDTTYYVIPPVGTDIYFLYYLLYVLNLGSLDKSTAIPGLNRNDAYNIKIPLPPLPEQHKIVEEIERRFSIADEVEKVVNKSLKQAERLRQSILKKTFEGKLVPQDPSDPPAIKLLERIKVEKAKLETELRNKRKKKT